MIKHIFLIFTIFAPFAVHAENTFRVRLLADPATFDWNRASTTMETPILMNIMDGLFEFDRSMQVKPVLANSWTISPDKLLYTFKIKTDAQWSDGTLLKAEDFVNSFERLLNPLTAAPYAYLFFDIAGSKEYNSGKNTDFSKVGIKSANAQTLEIKLLKPVPYFLQLLTFWVTFPIRKDLLKKHGQKWASPQADGSLSHLAVTGAFIPELYQPQNKVILKRNPKYHGKRPLVDTIEMPIINDDSTALNLFRAGQLDFVRAVNFLELGTLKNSPAFHNDPYYRNCFININVKRYPFNLKKVRQALSMSIDRNQIEKVLHIPVKTMQALIPANMSKNLSVQGSAFAPDKAKEKLKEAGIVARTLPKLEFLAYESDQNMLLMQFLQNQLQQNLGLNIELRLPEFKMFRTQLELQTSPLYLRCWGADYADPDSFFSVFLSNSGNNRTGWENSEYDELVRRAAVTLSEKERVALYEKASKLLLEEEAAIVPLYQDSLSYVLNPKVKNFYINPLNYVFFRDIVITK